MASSLQTSISGNGKLHIAMFPWLAFGHMIPYLELAKLIAQKGHKVSFISTPRNIDRLPKLPPGIIASNLHYIKLPLPQVDNLPENAEATGDLPYEKVQYLKKALDHMKDTLSDFLKSSNPDWVLHDFASYWFGSIASDLEIPSVYFSIMIAACLAFISPGAYQEDNRKTLEDFAVPPKWVNFPTDVAYKIHELTRVSDGFSGDVSGVTDLYRFAASMDGCDVLAVRSCSEFEPEWLHLLEQIHRKPVFPIGQIPTTANVAAGDPDADGGWGEMEEWLDKKDKGSVVYVAFGSEAKPTQTELTEISLGLEKSDLPFFWVLRKQRGSADTESIELPNGFEERTKGRGFLCTSWAPQMKILSHDAIGGFLTHSGWTSVVEATLLEKAMLLLTFLADQGINARILEEKKMAYSIPRDEKDGSFTRDSVAESLRLVMVDEQGKIYRDRVKEMKGLFGDKDRQSMYVDNFLNFLYAHKDMKKKKKDM